MLKKFSAIYLSIIILILYSPIMIVILFSFNKTKSRSVLSGLTLNWFFELFKDCAILNALKNSLILAISSAIFATILGTITAIQILKLTKKQQFALVNLNFFSLINPDITLGVSLMLFLQFLFNLFNQQLGFLTVLIAHITICLPFILSTIIPKFKQIDPNFIDAAQDLGCTPLLAFFKVIFPQIYPSLISAFLVAFTISFDDFTVSYFTAGSSFQTLPILIYSMVRQRITPKINALFTLIFIFALISLLFFNFLNCLTIKIKKKQNALN